MSSGFHVEWTDLESTRTVKVSGEIDIATVDELRRALECEQPRLTVDLSNVTFMDLAGLNSLLEAAAGREAVSLITSRTVDRLLDLTATTHAFDVL